MVFIFEEESLSEETLNTGRMEMRLLADSSAVMSQ